MLPPFLDRLTPRVYPRTRLLTAAAVWTAVGIFLCAKGVWFSRHEPWGLIFVPLVTGLGLGFAKSRLIFDRVGQKIIAHIIKKPPLACLGGLFSLRNWALIIIMSVFGRTLDVLSLNVHWKTGLYVMVGSGLAFSSRLMWAAWKIPAATELRRI